MNDGQVEAAGYFWCLQNPIAVSTELHPALQSDPEVARIVGLEHTRQTEGAELIASENYTSEAVMAAQEAF